MAKSWLLATVALVSSCVWAGPKVAVETTLGNFTIELNQEKHRSRLRISYAMWMTAAMLAANFIA